MYEGLNQDFRIKKKYNIFEGKLVVIFQLNFPTTCCKFPKLQHRHVVKITTSLQHAYAS